MALSFTGAYVAITTPFTADDQVDLAAMKRHIDWMIGEGVQGIVPCGTTGESATFDHSEQHRVIAEVVQHVRGRVPVIAGAGSNSTKEAMSLAKAAEREGADAILTITPYYNKPTQDGLVAHFSAVRQATRLPLMLYNVPGRTGINMAPETTIRLHAQGGIAGIKEATGSCEAVTELVRAGVPVLSGDDGMTLPYIAVGAQGVISVVANIAPRAMRTLCDAAMSGDLPRARQAHQTVTELARHCFAETNPIPVKTMVAALGFGEARFRLPLVDATPDKQAAFTATMRRLRLLS